MVPPVVIGGAGDVESQLEGMPMTHFFEACAVQRLDADRFGIVVPDGWQQGRGAFGGLGIGFAVRAMQTIEPDRALRVLTAELPGPLLVGEAEIDVITLRRGKGTTVLEAHVKQAGEVCVRVSGFFGRDRGDERSWVPTPPRTGRWQDVEPLPESALPPRFASAFEYRVTGPLPFSAGKEARAEGWIRLRGGGGTWGVPEVAAMADAYWPCCFAIQDGPRPMATVAYTLHLHDGARQLSSAEPLFYRANCDVAGSGFLFERRELWTADGQLVAVNPQTFIVIK